MKKIISDFRDFILRGNVIDLAIGVIIGAAFSTVVNSLVNNLLMPPIGLLVGNVDFQNLFIALKKGDEPLPPDATLSMAKEAGVVTWNYGQFITDVISFLIIALCVFLIVRGIKTLEKRVQERRKSGEDLEEEPTEKACSFCTKIIPVEASRCPFCTSHLKDQAEVENE